MFGLGEYAAVLTLSNLTSSMSERVSRKSRSLSPGKPTMASAVMAASGSLCVACVDDGERRREATTRISKTKGDATHLTDPLHDSQKLFSGVSSPHGLQDVVASALKWHVKVFAGRGGFRDRVHHAHAADDEKGRRVGLVNASCDAAEKVRANENAGSPHVSGMGSHETQTAEAGNGADGAQEIGEFAFGNHVSSVGTEWEDREEGKEDENERHARKKENNRLAHSMFCPKSVTSLYPFATKSRTSATMLSGGRLCSTPLVVGTMQ